MIKIYTINLDLEKNYAFNFDSAMKKYKSIKDKKLAFASKKLKKMVTKKFFSISHSYPMCMMAECDEPIGIDVENGNRKIAWEKIVKQKFSKEDKIPVNRNDFFLDWTTREAYFKCFQDPHYLSTSIETILEKTSIKTAHRGDYYIAICTKGEHDVADIPVWLTKNID